MTIWTKMTFWKGHEFVIGIEQYYLWSTVEGFADVVVLCMVKKLKFRNLQAV